ncbi:MAG: hypothetical protein HPY44_14090 [Armatimonadetes bacterium]|nr:hypothetical protein [Armatimonadota bacterium]
MPVRWSLGLIIAAATSACCAPAWQAHPGWDLLARERPREAGASFADSLKQAAGAPGETELAEGLRLGWSISVATAALDVLRDVPATAPETDAGKCARKLLVMLGQDDRERARAWAERGGSPWKEALGKRITLSRKG